MTVFILFLIILLQIIVLNVCVEFQTYGFLFLFNFLTSLPIIGIVTLIIVLCEACEYDPNSNFYCKDLCRIRPYVFDNELVKWLTKEKW